MAFSGTFLVALGPGSVDRLVLGGRDRAGGQGYQG
jgi:hypothetical protein